MPRGLFVWLNQMPAAAVARDRIQVDLDAEAGAVRDRKHAVRIQLPAAGLDLVDVRGTLNILDIIGTRDRRSELQVGGQAERGVPPVRDKLDPVLLRHPGDLALLADAADLADIRLHDVERAALKPGLERLPSGQHLTARD